VLQASQAAQLQETIADIQARWGTQALRSLSAAASQPPATLTSGLPALDAALGGGLPRGRIVEAVGVATSGVGTLALHSAAHVMTGGGRVAIIDCAHTLDSDLATGCGVDITQLVRVCPAHGRQALAITETLATRAGLDLLIFDSVATLLAEPQGAQHLSLALRRLLKPLKQTPTVLLFLAAPLRAARPDAIANGTALPHYAAVRLLVTRRGWVAQHGDTVGYDVDVTLLKNQFGRIPPPVPLRLLFNQRQDDLL
jgi:recombination protein RecA